MTTKDNEIALQEVEHNGLVYTTSVFLYGSRFKANIDDTMKTVHLIDTPKEKWTTNVSVAFKYDMIYIIEKLTGELHLRMDYTNGIVTFKSGKQVVKRFSWNDTEGMAQTYLWLAKYSPVSFTKICICGSMKFYATMLEVAEKLTSQKYIVLMPYLKKNGIDDTWYDVMHKEKIDMSDEIYVVNVDGYTGDSTRSEIEYALATHKAIQWHVMV